MAVGAAGIFTTYTSLLTTFVLGICLGMQPIVGYNFGAGQLHRLRRAYGLAVAAATAVCVAGYLGGMLVPQWIARAFTTDPELIAMTDTALRTAMMAFFFVGFQVVSTTLFQSIGAAAKSVFLSLTRQVIVLIPLLLTLPASMGLRGVWLSFPLSDTAATRHGVVGARPSRPHSRTIKKCLLVL